MKGFDNLIDVFSVVGEASATSRFDVRQTGMPTPLVGRDDELARLNDSWIRAMSGQGQMWRRHQTDEGVQEEVVVLRTGTSLTIPLGTHFQFRADDDAPLTAIGTAMPPWTGDDEAYAVEGLWQPTL